MRTPRSKFILGAVVAMSVTLSSCQADQGEPVTGEGADAIGMGNAQPAESPPADDPAGMVFEFDAISDLDATGEMLAARTADTLTIGTVQEVTTGGGSTYSLDSTCGDITARGGRFVVACGDSVRIFDSKVERTIETDQPATTAALTSTGEVLTGSAASRIINVLRDGEVARTFDVARETDRLLTIERSGQPDAAVRVSNFDTTIQDLDWEKGKQGGTLRAGIGVGGVSPGRDGLLLAADNTGDQILVYTTTDIIRLQQSAPVAESPWAVAWDDESALAWITSTATNMATGYDISHGVPVERASVNTVANALNMVALDDGTLVIASASGDGLQVIPAPEKHEN